MKTDTFTYMLSSLQEHLRWSISLDPQGVYRGTWTSTKVVKLDRHRLESYSTTAG